MSKSSKVVEGTHYLTYLGRRFACRFDLALYLLPDSTLRARVIARVAKLKRSKLPLSTGQMGTGEIPSSMISHAWGFSMSRSLTEEAWSS